MAWTLTDLRTLAEPAPSTTTASPITSTPTTSTAGTVPLDPAQPQQQTQEDEFEGFDPRGTLNRRRTPSSATNSSLSRSASLKQQQQQPSPASSVLGSGVLRKSSLLAKQQQQQQQQQQVSTPPPGPQRQVGFPSPSEISPKHVPHFSPATPDPQERVDGLPVADSPCHASSPCPAPVHPPVEDPSLNRGRTLERPSHHRLNTPSSLTMSSLSRSRSRPASRFADLSSNTDSPSSVSPAPPTSSEHRSSRSRGRSAARGSKERHSLGGSIEPPQSFWSPAQEFLSSFGKSSRTTNADSSPSMMDSFVSHASADPFGQGVEVDGWEIGRFLGAGSFGHVRTCQRTERPSTSTGDKVAPGGFAAVKIVPLAQDAPLAGEIDIWARLPPHDGVLPMLGMYSADNTSLVFMPLCEGGNLLEYLMDFGEHHNSSVGPVRSRGRRSVSNRASSIVTTSDDSMERAGGLPLHLAKNIFSQVAHGLAHLHTNGVTHCDVKLENILLDNDSGFFRLADFGMAQAHAAEINSEAAIAELQGKPQSYTEGFMAPPSLEATVMEAERQQQQQQEEQPKPVVDAPAGSLEYAAPERLKIVSSADLKPGVDIWALGCVLYALVSGSLPFRDDFEPRLRMKVLKGTWELPAKLMTLSEKKQAEAVLQVLQACLEIDVDKRWSIKRVLESEWMTTDWSAAAALSQAEAPETRRSSRSRSRGRRTALTIETQSQPSAAVHHMYTDHRDYSPYRYELYERQRRRSASRDSSSGSRNRRRPQSMSVPHSAHTLPDALSE